MRLRPEITISIPDLKNDMYFSEEPTSIFEKIFKTCVFIFVGILLILFGLILIGSGGTEDLAVFHRWLSNSFNNGISSGYGINNGDYPPLLVFTFYPVAFLKQVIGYWSVIHLSILFNLLFSTFLFYKISKNPALAIGFYFTFFYPAMILKYLDVNYTPVLLMALLCLSRRYFFWFGIFFTTAAFIKWQPLILAPFMAIYLILIPHRGISKYLFNPPLWKAAGGAITVIMCCGLYFGFEAIISALTKAIGEPYLSGNALNLHWILTHYLHVSYPEQYGALVDGVITVITPPADMILKAKLPFAIFYLLTLAAFAKGTISFENLLKFSSAAFFTYFILGTGVHENHLYIAVVLALWLSTIHRQYLLISLALIVAYNFNILIFQGFGRWLVTTQRFLGETDLTLPLAYAMLAFWVIYWITQIMPSIFPIKKPRSN